MALRAVLASSKQHIVVLRTNVVAMPRMTSELNRAKRGVVTALENLINEFTNGETLLSESEKVVREILGEKISP